jgi:hypothetical protein
MRIFSKIVFVCNVCFIISAIMRLVEISADKVHHASDAVAPVNPILASVLVLGLYLSFFLNALFLIIFLIKKLAKSPMGIETFILYVNLLMLPIEIWYNFIWKG